MRSYSLRACLVARISYLCALTCLVLPTAAPAAPSGPFALQVMGASDKEYVTFQVAELPTHGADHREGSVWMSSYVVEGDSLAWSQSLEIITGPRKGLPARADLIRAKLLEQRRASFATVTDSLVSVDDKSSLYVAHSSGAVVPGYPDEFTVTRIILGKKDMFVVIYTNRHPDVPGPVRELWIQTLRAARAKSL